MFYNTQDILLRRKLEQVELQQAIEMQGRRFMGLHLPEFKNDRLHHHQRSLSVGASVPLPPQSLSLSNQNVILPFDGIKQEVAEGLLIFWTIIILVFLSFRCRNYVVLNTNLVFADRYESPTATISVTSGVAVQQHQQEEDSACINKDGKEQISIPDDLDLHKRCGA